MVVFVTLTNLLFVDFGMNGKEHEVNVQLYFPCAQDYQCKKLSQKLPKK